MKVAILLVCCCFIESSYSQQHCDTLSFQTMYWVDDFQGMSPQKIIATKDNVFITGSSAPLDVTRPESGDVIIMKLSDRGVPLWSKNVGADLYNYSYEIAEDVEPTSDGGLIIAGETQRDQNKLFDGWVSKMSANGNIEWSVVFDSRASRLFKVIQLNDGTYAAIGVSYTNFSYDEYSNNISKVYNSEAYMVHLDKNGNKLWARSFFSKQVNNLYSIIQLHDGNLLAFGDSRDNPIITPLFPFLAKIDVSTGQFIWTNGVHYPDEGIFFPQLKEMDDHKICVHNGSNASYFDENGNEIKSISFKLSSNALNGLFVNYIGSSGDGEDYYYAFWTHVMYLLKIKKDSAIEWARTYSSSVRTGSLYEWRDAKFVNNSFYINIAIESEAVQNGTRNYAYFIKADAEGKTGCNDTLATKFIFSQPANKGNYFISFTDNGSPLKPLFRPMYAHDNSPHFIKDCYKFSCCNDTLQYKKAAICEGTNYILPDGNAVSKNGVYPSLFKSSKGCDSIIYTTLSVQQPAKVSLGNDTCFKNQYPVVYRLSNKQKVQYLWQDGSTDSVYTITQPGTYSVSVSTACNVATDSVVVFKDCEFPVYVPGAFTPNNDGRNDVLHVLNLNNQHFINLSIYNRFGERIFYSTDISKGWDGTLGGILQQTGTYIYVVRYADVANRLHDLKGTVVLLR